MRTSAFVVGLPDSDFVNSGRLCSISLLMHHMSMITSRLKSSGCMAGSVTAVKTLSLHRLKWLCTTDVLLPSTCRSCACYKGSSTQYLYFCVSDT